jgi:integration host factor subunit alpha
MARTKADLAASVSRDAALPLHYAREVVDQFFECMRENLETGHQIKLSGFGNFELRDKKARPGRNPRTGKVVEVSARRVVTFSAGVKLKEAIAKS